MELNVLVNGSQMAWGDINLVLFGRTVDGITAIKYGDKQEKNNNYGRGRQPVNRTRGKVEPEASITLYDYEVRAILDAAKQANQGKRLQDLKPFDVVVNYDNGDGVIRTDVLRNAEFNGTMIDTKTGDGNAIAMECQLIISHIEWNV